MKNIFFKKIQVSLLTTACSILISFFFFAIFLTEWVFSKSFSFLFLGYSTGNLLVAFFVALPVSLIAEWIVRRTSHYEKPFTIGIYTLVHLIVCAWLLYVSNHPAISIFFIILVTATYVGTDVWLNILHKNSISKSLLQKITNYTAIIFFLIYLICFISYQIAPHYPEIILPRT